MELRRLHYFAVLARHLHFGRAADELGIAQPGLSQQIKILERELGCALFERGPRGVALTTAGAALEDEADALLERSHLLRQHVQAAARATSGILRVAYTRSGGELATGALVRGFVAAHPEVDVETHTGWTSWNIAALQGREVDVAFVRGRVRFDGLSMLTLASEELIVALPEGHPLAQQESVRCAELREEPVVLWRRAQGPEFYDELVGHIWPDGGPKVTTREPEAEQILASVSEGTGISVLDRQRAHKLAPPGVALRPFADGGPRVPVGLAYRSDDRSPAAESFVQWCRDHPGGQD